MDERSIRVTRPDGRSLTIRPATNGDVEAIMALYASLAADDRRRRFFTLSYPRRELVERFIEATARDGLWLVAVTALLESARGGGGRGGDGDVIRLDVDDARDLADHGLDQPAATSSTRRRPR